MRILPGVDVLETRWSAAQEVFADSDLEIVGDEQTEGDAANTKQIVSDYIAREGELDGIWMDAGATSVAAAEAFEDAGQEIPPITGEDQLDFLRKWQEDDLTAIAPVYSNFQWRTPIIAATRILNGEEVPKEWILPQEPITEEELERSSRTTRVCRICTTRRAGARTCPVTRRTGSNQAESQYLSHREAAERGKASRSAAAPGFSRLDRDRGQHLDLGVADHRSRRSPRSRPGSRSSDST